MVVQLVYLGKPRLYLTTVIVDFYTSTTTLTSVCVYICVVFKGYGPGLILILKHLIFQNWSMKLSDMLF